jgi:hypothetical protein
MRRKLRVAAVLLALAVAGYWAACGANRGWTKTSVFEIQRDPVTELDARIEVKRFVPGADFLGAGLVMASTLAAGSFLIRGKSKTQN